MAKQGDRLIISVTEFIRRHRLFGKQDRMLVGVSGGMDSMVLADVLHRTGYRIGIAHVNFRLRGHESEQDALFVSDWAKSRGIPVHPLEASAKDYARTHRLGLQEAAREIRYKYFEKICRQEDYQLVAVAHHRDDAIETFFMHLMRGAGLRGLSSIPIRQAKIVRPLLGTERTEIRSYAKRMKLSWREDSSNQEEYYERNRIRKNLLPKLEAHAESGLAGISRSLDHLRFAREVFEHAISGMRKRYVRTLPDGTRYLSLPELRDHPFGGPLLHELLRGSGFEPGEPEKVLQARRSGIRFKTQAGYLMIDRERLILHPFDVVANAERRIGPRTRKIELTGGALNISRKKWQPAAEIPNSPGEYWLDLAQLTFPLTVRPWKAGDRFRPLGMKGSRKLSDYLTDRKYSLRQKEKVQVLLSEGRIVCILGERISEDVRITDSTRNILRLQWSPIIKP